MASARLIMVTHAATVATRQARFATGDEPLFCSGSSSAPAFRRKWSNASEILVGPARATKATADAFGLPSEECGSLRDLEVGRWIGKSLDEVLPSELAAWLADPDYAGHGGESLSALIARMSDFLSSRAAVRGTTVAFSHAAPVRAALIAALGAPASSFWHIDVAPAHALELSWNGTRWSLRGLSPIDPESS